MSKVLAVAANIILVASALGFGSLLEPIFPKSFSELDRRVIGLLGGIGILGTVLFCVGQVWFSRVAIVLVLLCGLLLSRTPIVLFGKGVKSVFTLENRPVVPIAIVSGVLLLTAVGGLALPTGDMNNDSIAYHYLGPKVWVREGVIRPIPDEVYTAFPVLIESQYAALMSLGGQRAPGVFAIVGLTSILLISASLGIRLGLGPSGAWWTAAVVAVMPAVYRGAWGGFLDDLFAGFVLAAARLAFDAEDPDDFILFGVFCGFTMGIKYTGLIAWVVLIFCSSSILLWTRRVDAAVVLKWLAISSGVAAAVASPFYLRNWIFYGCPIYPPTLGLLRFFPNTKVLPSVVANVVKGVGETGRGMGRSLGDFLLLPFNLTYHTANFRGAGGIGLVPLGLAPFGLIARRRDAFTQGLFLFGLLQAAAWFATAQESRFAISIYVLGAVFGVVGWKYASHSVLRNVRALSLTVVAISLGYGLLMVVPERINDVHAAVSNSFEIKRSNAETPRAASFEYINREPSVGKVLILNRGIAAYFIDKPYIKPFGRWGEQTIPGITNAQQAMSQLRSLQVTHVLDVQEDGAFSLAEHPDGLSLVFERGDARIYRVN